MRCVYLCPAMPSSAELIDAFLLSPQLTSLPQQLSLAKFSRLFPRSTSKQTIERVYAEVAEQRAQQHQRTRAAISATFGAGLPPPNETGGDEAVVAALVEQLRALVEHVEQTGDGLEQENRELLARLDGLVQDVVPGEWVDDALAAVAGIEAAVEAAAADTASAGDTVAS